MINKHGLFKKHLPPGGWEAILWGAGQISLDMKKICFRRCREQVCYLCFLFSAWLKKTNHSYSSVRRLLWEQATVKESTRRTGWAGLSRFVTPLPTCVQHRRLHLFLAVTCQCEHTSLSVWTQVRLCPSSPMVSKPSSGVHLRFPSLALFPVIQNPLSHYV